MKRLGIAAALALLVLGGPLSALADEGGAASANKSLEALLVEFADTPAQHQALASYYRGKAAEARSGAANHRSMAKHYAAGKLFERDAMRSHCEALAKKSEDAAADFEGLAAAHEAEAKR